MRYAAVISSVACLIAVRAEAGPCVSFDRASTLRVAAEKRTAAQYAAVLVTRKLVAVTLPLHSWSLERGNAEMGRVIDHRERGKTFQLVAMGQSKMRCGDPSFDFVRDGHKVFNVVRKPKTTVTSVDVCDCPTFKPDGCLGGGNPPDEMAIGYELPPGTMYAGPIEIEYAANELVPALPKCKPIRLP